MISSRHSNTSRELLTDGNWMRVSRKHYLHGSGAEITFDCNRRLWLLTGTDRDGAWAALWVAKYYAEQAGKAAR